MKNRILVACIGIPVILVVLFVLPEPFTPTFVAIVSAVGAYEIMATFGMNHARIALYTAALALTVPFWVFFGSERTWGLLALLIYLVLVFVEALISGFRVKMQKVSAGAFMSLIIAYCLSAIVSMGNLPLRTCYVFLPIVIPFVVDAVAMIVGVFLGKHKLCPNISPKKTVEGAIGGLIGGIVLCLLYGLIFGRITDTEVNYYFLAVYGILGGAITQVGDLAFSYIKRTCKRKDFGRLLGEHGGVLDRFDSVIFCAPLIELLVTWLPAFN